MSRLSRVVTNIVYWSRGDMKLEMLLEAIPVNENDDESEYRVILFIVLQAKGNTCISLLFVDGLAPSGACTSAGTVVAIQKL